MPDYATSQLSLIDARIDQSLVRPTKMGTVQSRDGASALAIVSFDGSSGLGQPVKCFETVVVDTGDRVGMVKFEDDWVIVGNYTPRTWGEGFFQVQLASLSTTTSSTYVDMPTSPTASVVKVRDNTQLWIRVDLSMYLATSTNTDVEIGARLKSSDATVDLDLVLFVRNINSITERGHWGGAIVTDLTLPAQGYAVTARWRRPTGSGTLSMNADDGAMVHVREVLP